MNVLDLAKKLSMSRKLPNLHPMFAIYAKRLCGSLETLPQRRKLILPGAKKSPIFQG